METLVAPFFNLLILVGGLVFLLREPVKAMVSGRHQTIRDEVARVRGLLQKARREAEEYQARLAGLDRELAVILEQARSDGMIFRDRLISEARRTSDRLVGDSQQAALGLVQDLRRQLASDLGGRIVQRSEAILKDRLTRDDRQRIQREFSRQVELTR